LQKKKERPKERGKTGGAKKKGKVLEGGSHDGLRVEKKGILNPHSG